MHLHTCNQIHKQWSNWDVNHWKCSIYKWSHTMMHTAKKNFYHSLFKCHYWTKITFDCCLIAFETTSWRNFISTFPYTNWLKWISRIAVAVNPNFYSTHGAILHRVIVTQWSHKRQYVLCNQNYWVSPV